MGVFQILCLRNDKVFIDSSKNVPGKINRHRFQLNAGVHPAKGLQTDWNEFGADAFEFEVLEPLEPRRDQTDPDYATDLKVLEGLWLEKLAPFGEKGYNERKMTSGERLQMIANKNRENRI